MQNDCRRIGWKLLTVTAASMAPAIPPERRDNVGDILCLTAGAVFGLCAILGGPVKST